MTNPKRCPHVGALLIGGHPVGELRCELDAGHDEERRWRNGPAGRIHHPWASDYDGIDLPTPHRATFEWEDDLPVVLDTSEASIEVEVPMPDAGRD